MLHSFEGFLVQAALCIFLFCFVFKLFCFLLYDKTINRLDVLYWLMTKWSGQGARLLE